ncbi:NAD(P)(+) transhydrogenase (Re/Si-specific) subunit alpha [Putridiphycobacter roseus]|uniref:proton-translocating NAD(P)(+) transhydrogenase n=1 Tax=Putridiphycobacter roseus TaxID=2219161 RepID=A0A2W1NEN9_9FLAO|nr:NAD(P) transhydrogenase subunit alpha [Putridiphycobacter roseus]PZE17563.1 NAD(P)(+) transhydrogenase (Re/Si-specific) subunit alpha [Putridiphycobacter roseus]
MVIGIVKEPEKEARVSLLAEEVKNIVDQGIEVWVEKGAGEKAYCLDDFYQKAGAILKSRRDLLHGADVILSIHQIELPEDLKSKVLIGIYQPLYHSSMIEKWAKNDHVVFSLDMLPRTTRAQTMDVLSSQSNVAGYGAFLIAAARYPHFVPMLMTAAGSVKPANLLVLGAGVAGLEAIATGHRLGAVVEAFDTRPVAKEEVESLGARFVMVEGAEDAAKAKGYAVEQSVEFQIKQKEKIAACIKKADIVITTAQIFGKKAPLLVTKEMIETMKPGSVIVDLAASTGGNTELTKDASEVLTKNRVTIIGNSNIPATFSSDSSKLYGHNISNFLKLITSEKGGLNLDFSDDLVIGTCMAKGGVIVNDRLNKIITEKQAAQTEKTI